MSNIMLSRLLLLPKISRFDHTNSLKRSLHKFSTNYSAYNKVCRIGQIILSCKPIQQCFPRLNNCNRFQSKATESLSERRKRQNRTSAFYSLGFTLLVGGCTYMSVLLYRLYCQATGKGGQAFLEDDVGYRVENMQVNKNRLITVNFNADINSTMMWNFKPQQHAIKVSPGETALAFYTARNPSNKPVVGIATYNVLPYEAGQYFNKIQCFCFEEQMLNPDEEVDMPVFFFLDPEYAEDPRLENINDIVLSYTFFEAKEGLDLPLPSFFSSSNK